MKKRMKNWMISIFFLIISFVIFQPVTAQGAADLPTRVINVVYDDSGSMIVTAGEKVDTWCQAKYSMEVFAAMLGENDTMNVYVMSDYDKGKVADHPRLILQGADGAAANVRQVHDMVTTAANTPFDSVRKAYNDLCMEKADEKWLVVLTDGEFEDGAFTNEQVEAFFAEKNDDIRIMFLGMGASAAEIRADEGNNIFAEKAETNTQILIKITEICTRIFNSNKLEVDVDNKKISFDVPMSELVVFAQGADVNIEGLIAPDGTKISSKDNPVSVKYSEVAATNYNDPKVDRELVGSIVTFKGNYSPGEYLLDVSGAETIEVYYKPDIEIVAYLVDGDGQEIRTEEGLIAGEYTLRFGFAEVGTGERVAESKLLGDVNYSAVVSYGDGSDSKQYTSGDNIVLEEGEYFIEATADYLKYNTVSTRLNFEVYRSKELYLSVEENPQYELDRSGFLNGEEHIVIKVTIEGEEITSEQWREFGLLEVEQIGRVDKRIDISIEKMDEPGRYEIYPVLRDGKTTIGDYGDIEFRCSLETEYGRETWSGGLETSASITDLRSWFWKNIDKVIKLIVLALIIVFFLGYVPGVKKYLPKKLKKAPTIRCESNVGMRKTWEVKGRYTKNRLSTMIPYKAETGTIRFLPRGVSGASALKVKAIGSNRMEIINTKVYAGKKNITFDGSQVDAKQKKNMRKTAGMRVKYETRDADYTCVLNK